MCCSFTKSISVGLPVSVLIKLTQAASLGKLYPAGSDVNPVHSFFLIRTNLIRTLRLKSLGK